MLATPTASKAVTYGTGPAFAECRVRERHPCDLEASCQPVAARNDNDLHWPGAIRDISTGGVGLVLGRRFEPGAGLAIELPASSDRPEETLLARVRHATRQPDGRWLHGCTFISELSEDEVERLLHTTKAQYASPAATVVADVTFQGLAADGRPVRFTARRTHAEVAWPPAAGTALAIRVNTPDGPEHIRIVADKCWERNNAWTVRSRFVELTRSEVLRLLGDPAFQS
jgi:hypothetical protein